MLTNATVEAVVISTHALTWSATAIREERDGYKANFNSRAHVERDAFYLIGFGYLANFNSRAHVERDHFSEPPAV